MRKIGAFFRCVALVFDSKYGASLVGAYRPSPQDQ